MGGTFRSSGWWVSVDTCGMDDASQPSRVAKNATEGVSRVTEGSEGHETECSICLHPAKGISSLKSCGHVYCADCIRRWCATKKNPTCPVCGLDAEFLVLIEDGTEERLEYAVDATDDAPVDLSGLDHAYFLEESNRLLSRARIDKAMTLQAICTRGRSGMEGITNESNMKLDFLDHIIASAQKFVQDMESGKPFDPAHALHSLYELEGSLDDLQRGDLTSRTLGNLENRRYGASDSEFSDSDASEFQHSEEDDIHRWDELSHR